MSLKTERIKQPVVTGTTQPLKIGGISTDDAKLTVATDGSISTATPLTVPSLTVNSKPVMSSLLAEYTVTGSAVTSIDFSGLDINTHKSYRIEFEIYNTAASSSGISLFINNDTTQTNYYTQQTFFSVNALNGTRENVNYVLYVEPSTITSGEAIVFKTNGYASYNSLSNFSTISNRQIMMKTCMKTATVTNITQLTFTATVANSIGVGSTIRIYRSDV